MCPDENRIAGFLRGDLPAAEREQIEVHLDGCGECRALVSELARGQGAHAAADGVPETPTRVRSASIRWPAERGEPGVTAEVAPGAVIAEKYRVERILGGGGMGVVVAARHIELGQLVALKFMHPAMLRSEEATLRFKREARAAARLKNEHVGRVLDLGTLESGEPYIAMEYLEGEDLSRLLQREGRLSVPWALELIRQACSAVGEAHAAGIVHRDLKPANLFVTRRSDGGAHLKILDFGISKVVDGGGADLPLTRTSNLIGSPIYMAPEQLMSARDVDQRADLWSLGVILYELISGQRPFQAGTLPQLVARVLAEPPRPLSACGVSVPAPVEAAIERCLARDPAQRFGSAEELRAALAEPAGEAAAASGGAGRRRRGWLLWAGTGALGLLAGVVVAVRLLGEPASPPAGEPAPAALADPDAASVEHLAAPAEGGPPAAPAPTPDAAAPAEPDAGTRRAVDRAKRRRRNERARRRRAARREERRRERERERERETEKREASPIDEDDILEPEL